MPHCQRNPIQRQGRAIRNLNLIQRSLLHRAGASNSGTFICSTGKLLFSTSDLENILCSCVLPALISSLLLMVSPSGPCLAKRSGFVGERGSFGLPLPLAYQCSIFWVHRSGKSSLIMALFRAVDPSLMSGQVIVGGVDTRTLRLAELRESLGCVLFSTFDHVEMC